jgi:hypothetical protein
MKPPNKLKPKDARRRRPKKTKEDFLRWLKERRALEKLEAEEKMTKAAQEMKKALMVWVDDGGPPA